MEKIKEKAYQWKQWHWYFTVEKHIIENLTFLALHNEALEKVQELRVLASSITSSSHLNVFVDIAEMAARRRIGDFDRLEILVDRTPKIRDTMTYKMAVDEHRGRKVIHQDAAMLPDQTPRDLIWRNLVEVSFNVDSEKIAMAAMHRALKVGAEVGAKETFLRQRNEMANYIIRIANDFPTVYNEEIATAMAERMRERESRMSSERTPLTKRELEILRQLSTGRTLTVIASELHISQNTMKTHLKNLYRKIGAEGRHDAVEKAKSSFLI
jgi:ATP/maltotriose-dependent transcriptional regulator MalT